MQYDAIIWNLWLESRGSRMHVSALKENIGNISSSNISPVVSAETHKLSETYRGQNLIKND